MGCRLVSIVCQTRIIPSAQPGFFALQISFSVGPRIRSASTQPLLPVVTNSYEENIFMPASTVESCQDNRAASLGSTGTIVLTSSCRLLFIDRNAISFLGTLDSNWLAPTGAPSLPTDLITMVQKIAAHSATDGCLDSLSVHMSQVLGSRSQPIRVQGFTVLRHEQRERRFVLVLSRSNPGTMA
jgi:hypothetical protein